MKSQNKPAKKTRNPYVNISIALLLGAIFGLFSTQIIGIIHYLSLAPYTKTFTAFMEVNLHWFHLILGFLFQGLTLYLYVSAKRLLTTLNMDDDNDVIELEFDDKVSLILLVNTVFLAINFVVLGLSFTNIGLHTLWNVLIFICLSISGVVFEIKAIQLIQRKDPTKLADPGSIKFDKQWINSCDEAERHRIYKASYQTNTIMKYILIFALSLTLITKIEFNTGNLPIVLIGGIWIVQTVTYSFYARFYAKDKYIR